MIDRRSAFDTVGVSLKRNLRGVPVLLPLLILAMAARCQFAGWHSPGEVLQDAGNESHLPTAYVDEEYGFRFDLPHDWSGFSVIREQWSGTSPEHVVQDQSGPLIRIRHPKYTKDEPYEDIPIMVFTQKQWRSVDRRIWS